MSIWRGRSELTRKVHWCRKQTLILSEELLTRTSGYYKVGEDGRLVLANGEALALQNKNYEVQLSADPGQTNETVYVSEKAQKLTEEEIKELKAETSSPDAIIGAIVANNANFEKRSEFSKQKYLDKKQRKYNLVLKVERCGIDSLNTFFVEGRKDYIFNREDYLAYLLNHVQATDGGEAFVAERARGVVLTAVLRKFTHKSDYKLWAWTPKGKGLDTWKFESVKMLGMGQQFKDHVLGAETEAFQQLVQKITVAVIATDESELAIINSLEGKLAYNAKIVIFTNYYEIASAVYEHLVSKAHYVNLLFNDYMYREIQAWPMRSHPTMLGNTCAGYIVSAINVNPADK